MIIDESTYLEHYGVKGMRWGVRKSRSQSNSIATDPKKEARKAKYRFARNLTIGVAGGAVVGYTLGRVGTKTVATIMDNKKKGPAAEINFEKHMRQAAKLRQQFSQTKVPTTRKNPNRFSDAADLKKMREHAAASIREANAQLRARDNELNIPFAERTYLKEWV